VSPEKGVRNPKGPGKLTSASPPKDKEKRKKYLRELAAQLQERRERNRSKAWASCSIQKREGRYLFTKTKK